MTAPAWLGCILAAAFSLASVGPAAAVVTLGPGKQALSVSVEEGELVFKATGVADTVSLFSFVIEHRPDDPYEPITDGKGYVLCTMASDLQADFQPLVFFFPDRDPGELIVGFGDTSFPLKSFPRDGVIGRCAMRLKDGVRAGIYDLPCGSGVSASTAKGIPVEATCEDGTLDVASVIVSLGQQRFDAERGGVWDIAATGIAGRASSVHVTIEHDEDDPYTLAHRDDEALPCSVASDLTGFGQLPSPFPDPEPGELTIGFGDPSPPFAVFPRDGIVGRCRVLLARRAPVGTFELPCGMRSSATEAAGSPLGVSCQDGTLEIVEVCLGDSFPPFGVVTADEAAAAILDFGRGFELSPFADLREPFFSTTADEAATAVLNFARGDCAR